MKMLPTTLLLISYCLAGCESALFSSQTKKKEAAPASLEVEEQQIRDTLLNAPIDELYKSLTYVADDNAFTVSGFEFDGIRSRLQSAGLEIQKLADAYPTYKEYLIEQSIPEKSSLTAPEKRDAIEKAYKIFQLGPATSVYDQEMGTSLPMESEEGEGSGEKKTICVSESVRSPVRSSSFYACAKIAAAEGFGRKGVVSLDTLLGWAWNRGECGITMASELYNLINRLEEQKRCQPLSADPATSPLAKKSEIKK